MRIIALLSCCLLASSLLAMTPPTAPQLAPDAVAESGYREDRYRAPTPASVAEGWTVNTTEAQALLDAAKVIPIDVVAAVMRPAQSGLAAAWLPKDGKPRHNIPGSVWLPNVGEGVLTPAMDEYFRAQLQALTEGNKDQGLLFYCKVDCWMSWNAIKRAASYGYRQLYWYPDGDTGWQDADLPLEASTPVPPPD